MNALGRLFHMEQSCNMWTENWISIVCLYEANKIEIAWLFLVCIVYHRCVLDRKFMPKLP